MPPGPGCGRTSASLSTTIEAVFGRSSAAKATGSALSGSRPCAPRISYLYLSPAFAPGTKISQKPLPRTPHGVAPPVPEIEIADHAHALRIGREHREGDAGYAVMHPRMGAELVVEVEMRALAQEVEIEVGEHRREAVWVFQVHGLIPEPHQQAITLRPAGQSSHEQPGIVDAHEVADIAPFVDRHDLGGVRQEDAHDRETVFEMRAEIAKRVRVAAFDDRMGFRRELAHVGRFPNANPRAWAHRQTTSAHSFLQGRTTKRPCLQ